MEITAEGPRLSITCGNARFSLPTLPVEDYPSLPSMPSSAGVVDSDVFAEAVSQVAVAAGRDDTLPMLTGVRLEIEDDLITLAATDRYRLAVREFAWRPETPGTSAAVLVPARTLADAAKTLTSGPEIVPSRCPPAAPARASSACPARTGRPRPGCWTPSSSSTARSCRASPRSSATLPVGLFTDAAKRVALVAERGTPLRCEFTPGQVTLRAGGTDDEGQAEERCDVEFDGEPLTIGFNPTFLLDGLAAVHTERARMDFTSPLKPAVLSGVDEPAGGDDAAGPPAAGQLPLPDHAGAPARLRPASRDAATASTMTPVRTRERGRRRAAGADRAGQDGRQHGRAAAPRRSRGRRVRPLARQAGRRQPAGAGRRRCPRPAWCG